MTTYKEIKGTGVQNFSSDPANPIEGQVWYNTTSDTLKLSIGPEISAWATGGNLNLARGSTPGSAGSNTAAIVMGGFSDGALTNTESYNGTSWTEVNDLNIGRSSTTGTGSQTAALVISGIQLQQDKQNLGMELTGLK